jgi:hypothetical protein
LRWHFHREAFTKPAAYAERSCRSAAKRRHCLERSVNGVDTPSYEAILSEMVVAVQLLAPRGFASAKALLVPFAAFGKSNCLPRHERQTYIFLYYCSSLKLI